MRILTKEHKEHQAVARKGRTHSLKRLRALSKCIKKSFARLTPEEHYLRIMRTKITDPEIQAKSRETRQTSKMLFIEKRNKAKKELAEFLA